ncbi:MAG: hypothetical protein AB7T06_15750 [Kofleriaceae bacterium]
MRAVLVLLLTAACARATSGASSEDGSPFNGVDAAIDGSTTDGSILGDAGNGDASAALDANTLVDASATIDASVAADANGPSDSASTSVLTQYSSRSCWSWGGFGTVRPDAPAHVLGYLEDADGVGDIVMQAEVIILGAAGAQFSLGSRALESLGDTGCCRRGVKVPIDYTDFVAAAQAIDADTMWGARVVYRDLGGHTTSAICDGVAGWRLNSTPIGS